MSTIGMIFQRLRSLWSRRHQDLEREIQTHLDIESYELQADGMKEDAARDAARRAFGNPTLIQERTRDAWTRTFWDQAAQDLKFAARTLRRRPAFTTVAILSLALGIGANATIFTFVNAVLLRPLPYPEPDRIVELRERTIGKAGTVAVHPFNFLQWKRQSKSLDSLAITQSIPVNIMGPDGAEQVPALQLTSELFAVFGVQPFLGRAFTEPETLRGGPPAAILSYELWERNFASDPNVIGKKLRTDTGAQTIVGVMPRGLRIGTMTPSLYLGIELDPAKPDYIGSRSFACYGRIKSGITVTAARAELDVIAAQLAREYPLDKDRGLTVTQLQESLARGSRGMLLLLASVVAAVLLIACVNLAGLLLTRGIGRRSELALRASLGAGRGRLVRQLVMESFLLAIFGGAAGFFLSQWTTRILLAISRTTLTAGIPDSVTGFDWRVLAFTFGLSTLTALVFGWLPAWQSSRLDLQSALRSSSRTSSGDRRQGFLRSALVIGEVALAVVLLVGGGLLLRTFARMMAVDPGFKPEQTVTMRLFMAGRNPAQRVDLIEQILDRVETLPSVQAAGAIQFLPAAGPVSGTNFRYSDQANETSALPTEASLVSRGYFAAMGIPLLAGRWFERQDRLGSPPVVVVNQAFVKRYYSDGRAVGRRIEVSWSTQAVTEIIGVVGDVRHSGLTSETKPMVFKVHAQAPGYITHLVVRSADNPLALASSIRSEIQRIDPSQAISAVKTMEQYLSESVATPRMNAALVATFAGLALLLAAIGLYGLIAYVVGQRTQEIGIRLALGSSRGQVLKMVLRQGATLVFGGLLIGLTASLALARLISNLLFGVSPEDPLTYAAVAALLLTIGLIAAAIPARRASRVDPVIALRYD